MPTDHFADQRLLFRPACPLPSNLSPGGVDDLEAARRGTSGGGPPHSKTLTRGLTPRASRSVLECASPLALLTARCPETTGRWRRGARLDIYFNGPDGQPLNSHPTNNSISITYPAGVLARLRRLIQQIKKATAYTPPMGAELGILTPAAPAREPKPLKVKAEAGENSHVMVDCPLRGWDAVEFEGRRNNGPWELLAVCLKRKYTDVRPPLVAGQPEVREYRLRYRLGDEAQEVYSDVVRVTTRP